MRQKEFAADYRFALEPDIPHVDISVAVDKMKVDLNVSPFQIESILI